MLIQYNQHPNQSIMIWYIVIAVLYRVNLMYHHTVLLVYLIVINVVVPQSHQLVNSLIQHIKYVYDYIINICVFCTLE